MAKSTQLRGRVLAAARASVLAPAERRAAPMRARSRVDARERRGDPQSVHGRAGEVDRAGRRAVTLALSPLRKAVDTSGALRSTRCGGCRRCRRSPAAAWNVLQVGAAQAERPRGVSGRSPSRPGTPAGRSAPVRNPSSLPIIRERAGLPVGDHDALAPQALRERGPRPDPPRGWASTDAPVARLSNSSELTSLRGRHLSSDRPRRRGDHGDDGDDEQRGERRDGDPSSCTRPVRELLMERPPSGTERSGTLHGTLGCHTDYRPASRHVRARNRKDDGRAGGCRPSLVRDPGSRGLLAVDRELHHVHEQRVAVVRQHGEPHEADVRLARLWVCRP